MAYFAASICISTNLLYYKLIH